MIDGKTLAAGEYSVFIDLKENNWTFIVSTWPAQERYEPQNRQALWGAYNYTPDKDVLRTPMKLEALPHSVEELTWQFLDMSNDAGTIAISWDKVRPASSVT